MLYSYLAGLNHQMVGLGGAIIIASILLFRNFGHWGGLLVGLVLAYALADKQNFEGSNFIEQMEAHLNSKILSDTKFFYLDPDMINLFVSIKEYQDYNPITFYQLKHTVDQILRNVRMVEIGVDQPANVLKKSMDLMSDAHTLFESFNHQTPSLTESLKKHDQVGKTLRKLLNIHLDKIYHLTAQHYQKKGIDVTTQFIYPHHPDAFSFDSQISKFTRC